MVDVNVGFGRLVANSRSDGNVVVLLLLTMLLLVSCPFFFFWFWGERG